MSKEESKTLFERQAKSPEFWYGNAECFEHTALKLLELAKADETVGIVSSGEDRLAISARPPSAPLRGVITLLLGLAIENQVKAILIALKAEDLVKDGELDGKFATHNLRDIIGKANCLRPNLIRLKGLKDRQKLLDKLTSAVVWGKYGLPQTADELHKIRQKGFPPIAAKCGHPMTDDEVEDCKQLSNDLKRAYLSATSSEY
jgi:hypothetical protein